MKTKFQLRYPSKDIECWAERYENDDSRILPLVPIVQAREFLTKHELLTVCRWKTGCKRGLWQNNTPDFIRDVTQCAFNSDSERLRIEVLTLLRGVNWSTATVLMHFFHPHAYPIMDHRAVWSLKASVPSAFQFEFWMEYTNYCRSLSTKHAISMRTLGRSLWQFSKENQPQRW